MKVASPLSPRSIKDLQRSRRFRRVHIFPTFRSICLQLFKVNLSSASFTDNSPCRVLWWVLGLGDLDQARRLRTGALETCQESGKAKV